MTNKEAIKYLQQLYPNGGHCWLDEQRIEAIGIAINALQEEPVSEFLNTESMIESYKQRLISQANGVKSSPLIDMCLASYKHGINETLDTLNLSNVEKTVKIWKDAQGDDLPEYDREVIAILDYDFGHYKVVYAHRPNPNGWNGTNIDTGENEHFEPEIYDKGGWNQPHILYWLDTRLPYEENEIIKEL